MINTWAYVQVRRVQITLRRVEISHDIRPRLILPDRAKD